MTAVFHNRIDAAQSLVEQLSDYRDRSDVQVVGLPRGGVVIAAEVARILQVPWDICLVRKLGVPGAPELAMGAIAENGVQVLNVDIIRQHHIAETAIAAVSDQERQELARRAHLYRGKQIVADQSIGSGSAHQMAAVIVVDDGIATGATMQAAVRLVRVQGQGQVVVAVPVAAREAVQHLQAIADRVIVHLIPDRFYSVGYWYESFTQVSDEEVCALLAQSSTRCVIS